MRKSVSYVTCKQLRSARGDGSSLWTSVFFSASRCNDSGSAERKGGCHGVSSPAEVGPAFGPSRMVPTATGPALGCEVMLEFHLSVDALGKTRFAYSPLAEVASSLRLLGEGRHAYVMMPWLETSAAPSKDSTSTCFDLAPPGRWAPEFLFAWSYNPAITIEQQLDAMSRLPGGQIRDDLRGTWKDGSVPPNLQGLLEDEEAPRAGQRLDLRLLAGRDRPILAADSQRHR